MPVSTAAYRMTTRGTANPSASQTKSRPFNAKQKHLSPLICDKIIDSAIANADVDERKSPAGYQKGIRSVDEYMNDNYTKELTVEYLAKTW